MKNSFFVLVLCLSITVSGCAWATADSDKASNQASEGWYKKATKEDYEQLAPDFLYKSCKESLADNTFYKSPCRVAILSAFLGATYITQAILTPERPKDPYRQGEWDAIKAMHSRLCMPADIDLREVAERYISMYEDEELHKSHPDLRKATPEYALVASILGNYSCHAIEERINGMDNSGK